ncbi:MAG: cytochrome c oxidase subunit II [Paludibacter sp.]
MYSNASNFVHGVDNAFMLIFGISIFFLVTLTGTMIYFIIRYNKKRHPKAEQIEDNMWLEVTWTVIPTILVFIMFYVGWSSFLPMRIVPKNVMHVKAVAKMWKYTFEYEGNKESDTLVLPVDIPVKVDLISKDVLHGFSIPAFRIKEDIVPFKNNYSWFTPGEKGDFELYCTVYCGVSHSYMYTIVRVVDQDYFKQWLAKLPVKKADNNLGRQVLEKNGCTACHSLDGSKTVGPTFKGLHGTMVDVTTNGVSHKVKADNEYIKSSILDPNKDIVNGYPQGVMKAYKISDKDIELINEYLKNLK